MGLSSILTPQTITVFVLAQGSSSSLYQEAGVYNKGDMAVSRLLEGFAVDVTTVFGL